MSYPPSPKSDLLRKWIAPLMACVLVWLAPLAVQAQSAGAARDAAIAAWLADDELAGLRGLAELAQAGDAPAQTLLGLIDRHAALQGPAVLALPRADRIALLRAPGGLSGRNWLAEAAAQGDELARAWHALGGVAADLDVAAQFAALNEPRALAQALLTVAKRQERGFGRDILAQDWYPGNLGIPVAQPDAGPRTGRKASSGRSAAPLHGWAGAAQTRLARLAVDRACCPSSARGLRGGLPVRSRSVRAGPVSCAWQLRGVAGAWQPGEQPCSRRGAGRQPARARGAWAADHADAIDPDARSGTPEIVRDQRLRRRLAGSAIRLAHAAEDTKSGIGPRRACPWCQSRLIKSG